MEILYAISDKKIIGPCQRCGDPSLHIVGFTDQEIYADAGRTCQAATRDIIVLGCSNCGALSCHDLSYLDVELPPAE